MKLSKKKLLVAVAVATLTIATPAMVYAKPGGPAGPAQQSNYEYTAVLSGNNTTGVLNGVWVKIKGDAVYTIYGNQRISAQTPGEGGYKDIYLNGPSTYVIKGNTIYKKTQKVTPTVNPTTKPTVEPTTTPTTKPSVEPTVDPVVTNEPTTAPTTEPTTKPTAEPTSKPSTAPTDDPVITTEPTTAPTTEPTVEPTTAPTVEPTNTTEPTVEPTTAPTKVEDESDDQDDNNDPVLENVKEDEPVIVKETKDDNNKKNPAITNEKNKKKNKNKKKSKSLKKSNTKKDKDNVPQTGDNSNITTVVATGVASLIGLLLSIFGLVFRRKRGIK